MSIELRDIQVSALKLAEESAAPLAADKYNRTSIPFNPNRHCLGYLEGYAADLREPTRNGRKYPIELWKKVQESEDFQEGMKCATIVGELDHPEERVDYSLTKGAVILTDFEIREDEGYVWTRFAILDNDEGRTLLSYVKFGTVLGVSSRGLGDEIQYQGENCIDPETYEFYCFDVVAMPAAAAARMKYANGEKALESAPVSVKKAFTERVTREIENAESEEDLNSLKAVIESTNVPEKDSLVETISNKISRLSESADKQGAEEDEDDRQVLLGSEEKDQKDSHLKELLKRRSENAKAFRKSVQEQRAEIEQLEDAVSEGLSTISSLSKMNNDLTESLATAKLGIAKAKRAENRAKESAHKEIAEVKKEAIDQKKQVTALTRTVESLKSQVSTLTESLEAEKHKVSRYERNARSLENTLKSYKESAEKAQVAESRRVTEAKKVSETKNAQISALRQKLSADEQKSKDLTESLHKAEGNIKILEGKLSEKESLVVEMVRHYAKAACKLYGLKEDVMSPALADAKSFEEIDRICKESAKRQEKLIDLHITTSPMKGTVNEHLVGPDSESSGSSFLVEALRNN